MINLIYSFRNNGGVIHYSPYRGGTIPLDLGDQHKSFLKPIPPANINLPPGVNYRNNLEPEVLLCRGGKMIVFWNVPHTITKLMDGSYDLCLTFYHEPYPPSFFQNELIHPQYEYYKGMERIICKSWRIEVSNFARYEVIEEKTYTCIKLFYA